MSQISRRRMLRGSAVLLTGGAAGALVTSGTAQTATAAEASLSVAGDEATVRNGDLAAVWLAVGVEWSYAVPSGERPETLVVDVLAGTDPEAMDVVASAESSEVFLESSGSESFEVDLLESALTAADLVPEEGGETAETTVHVGTEMRLHDESDLVIAADSQTDTATVALEKSAYDPDEHGSLSGAGELTIELE